MAKKTLSKTVTSRREESVSDWISRHINTIKGISLITVGLLLIGITSPVIVRLLILIAGGFLVYSGLLVLRAHHVTNFIDEAVRKMRAK